jgi:hypothetical protein
MAIRIVWKTTYQKTHIKLQGDVETFLQKHPYWKLYWNGSFFIKDRAEVLYKQIHIETDYDVNSISYDSFNKYLQTFYTTEVFECLERDNNIYIKSYKREEQVLGLSYTELKNFLDDSYALIIPKHLKWDKLNQNIKIRRVNNFVFFHKKRTPIKWDLYGFSYKNIFVKMMYGFRLSSLYHIIQKYSRAVISYKQSKFNLHEN